MLRKLSVAAMATASILAVPLQAAPLAPTSPWNLNYTATSCDAKRRFGDIAIVISPAPLGETYRLMMEFPGNARLARQHPAKLTFAGDAQGERLTALIFPLSKKGQRGLYAVLPSATAERILETGELDLRIGIEPATKTISFTMAHIELALGKSAGLRKALATCLADLQRHWGMADGKLPEPAPGGQPSGNLTGLFRSEDYPADAFLAGQGGQTNFLIMVGTDGRVMDCIVRQSSGVASLDAMGCQVIRQRARYQPAKDAAGKPIVGTLVQSVKWVLQ